MSEVIDSKEWHTRIERARTCKYTRNIFWQDLYEYDGMLRHNATGKLLFYLIMPLCLASLEPVARRFVRTYKWDESKKLGMHVGTK